MNDSKEIVYLDHAAATPLLPTVKEVMEPYLGRYFANPQAAHEPGREARTVIDQARARIAGTLGVQISELVFTSGATEANSLALLGAARAYQNKGSRPLIFLSAIAHPSVLQITSSYPEVADVELLPVKESGEIDLSNVPEGVSAATIISVEHANSEVGTIQPLQDISALRGKPYPLLHVDASQSAGYLDVQPHKLGADLLTINSHKLGGPKGIGLLWVRSGTPLAPLLLAASNRQVGDYQRLRPGTPSIPLIVGLAEALVQGQRNHQSNAQEVQGIQDYCLDRLEAVFPDFRLNGSRNDRAPHNVNVTFPGVDHDYLATQLAARGIAVATTSACQSGASQGSEVLAQLHGNNTRGLRFSFGMSTTKGEIDRLMTELERLL